MMLLRWVGGAHPARTPHGPPPRSRQHDGTPWYVLVSCQPRPGSRGPRVV